MAQVFVCSELEMKDGDVRIVRQDKVEVGIYRHDGSYYAYRNHCAHQGGPACEGIVRDKVVDLFGPDRTFLGQTYDKDEPHIVCPWHGWEYKLKTGECAPDPKIRLKRYEVVKREGGVYGALGRPGTCARHFHRHNSRHARPRRRHARCCRGQS